MQPYTMRYCIALLLVSILACTYAEELYSDKYDHVKIKEILETDELRNSYYDCFMDTAPCATEALQFFRKHITEAIVTKCKKCTEKQKENLNLMADWYSKNQPDKWNALVEKLLKEIKAGE